jgi:hypothetical protein
MKFPINLMVSATLCRGRKVEYKISSRKLSFKRDFIKKLYESIQFRNTIFWVINSSLFKIEKELSGVRHLSKSGSKRELVSSFNEGDK